MTLTIGEMDKIFLTTKDGKSVDVTTLCKEDYEKFLELMMHLRLAYMSLIPREVPVPSDANKILTDGFFGE